MTNRKLSRTANTHTWKTSKNKKIQATEILLHFHSIILWMSLNVIVTHCTKFFLLKRKCTNVNFYLKTSFLVSSSSLTWFLFRLLHMMFCVAFVSYIVLFHHWMQWKPLRNYVRWYVNEMKIMWWVSNKQQLLINFFFIDFHSRSNFHCLLSKIFWRELCWGYKRCNL